MLSKLDICMLRSNLFLIVALLLLWSPASAIEFPRTTRDYVKSTPYIAVAEVENVVSAPGGKNLVQYRVSVLEEWKGNLPGVIDIRIFSASRVIQPSPILEGPGSRWIVFLGPRTNEGFYPLKSLHWGKIELLEDASGDYWLARPVTGFGKSYEGKRLSLDQFRTLVKGNL